MLCALVCVVHGGSMPRTGEEKCFLRMQNVLHDFLHGAFSVRNEIYDFFRFFIILLDIFLVGLIQRAGLDNLLISRVNDNLWEIIIVHDDMQLPVFLRDIKIR